MPPYLSKSDFKVASSCPAKLYYRKLNYPTALDDDPYMQMLADGGYMVGKLAQLQYPEGILVSSLNPWDAVEETRRLLQNEVVTIFEAALYHDHKLVRIDILRKLGDNFELIEVKSRAVDSSAFRAGAMFSSSRGVRSEWRDYLEDVAYQAQVLRAAIPKARIRCFLLTPDKAKTAKLNGLCQRFRLRRQRNAVEVEVVGDPNELTSEDIITLSPVDAEVQALAPEVGPRAAALIQSLVPDLTKLPAAIGYDCRNCEFRTDGADLNGFRECWGTLADVNPHIF